MASYIPIVASCPDGCLLLAKESPEAVTWQMRHHEVRGWSLRVVAVGQQSHNPKLNTSNEDMNGVRDRKIKD